MAILEESNKISSFNVFGFEQQKFGKKLISFRIKCFTTTKLVISIIAVVGVTKGTVISLYAMLSS